MNIIRTTFLLTFLMSTGLFAGDAVDITKDDENYKKLKLSFDYRESAESKDKYTVNVKVGKLKKSATYSMEVDKKRVYLYSKGKNTPITPTIKDGKYVMTFEVEKKKLKDSRLLFSYLSPSNCPPAYSLEMSDYIKEAIAKKDDK